MSVPASYASPGGRLGRLRSVPDTTDVVGIGLAGGQGVRARPLTLKAPGYLRSKAAMSFLGRRLIQWVIQVLGAEGIKQYYLIAHGKENRYQIKVMVGYGETMGVDVQYSPVKFDALSTGSADSTLRMIEHWDLRWASRRTPLSTSSSRRCTGHTWSGVRWRRSRR